MTAPTVPDPWVTPILSALLDCLCETLNMPPYTPVECGCVIRHSADVPSSDQCNFGWVQLVRAFPSPQRTAGCPGLTVLQVRLGVYRCVATVDDNNVLPPSTVLTNEALLFQRDHAAMRRAVMCCEELSEVDYRITGWQPLGPQGGCAGGALTVEYSINMGAWVSPLI